MPLVASLRCRSAMVIHGYASHVLELAKLPHGLVKWPRWLPHVFTLPIRIRRFDRVVFLSHKTDWGRFFDARLARLTGARNIAIIPIGVPDLPDTPPGGDVGTEPFTKFLPFHELTVLDLFKPR